jgi:hypothetical protein
MANMPFVGRKRGNIELRMQLAACGETSICNVESECGEELGLNEKQERVKSLRLVGPGRCLFLPAAVEAGMF